MESLKNKDGKPIVLEIVEIIQNNKDYLSDVDGKIGDGDHGVNMNKGFTIAGNKISETDCGLSEALAILGDTLMSEIGGSMGPIYGTFFIEMADASKDKKTINAIVFGDMLTAAVEGLSDIVEARRGDKTIMDVILPAHEAYALALDKGESFPQALEACVKAANEGRDSTKDMVAKFGRASRLGERSKGVTDAGATSCALIIEGLAQGIKKRLT